MHSKLGRSLLTIVICLSLVAVMAVLTVGRSKTAAEAEPPEAPTLTAVEVAQDQLKAGQVWDAAATVLGELRSLPSTAAAIDQALAPMQLLTFIMSSLMQDDELQTFVKQLDPTTYPGDNLVLMSFYDEFRAWEPGRKMSFITEDDFWKLADTLTQDKNALVRMAALLTKTYRKPDMSSAEGRAAAVDIINKMADECPDCRVTREMFRVLLREAMWRTTEDTEAVAEDVYPEAIAELLLDSKWNENMSALISQDKVVQRVFAIFSLPAVSAAQSKDEALATLITEALTAAQEDGDLEVRSWLRGTLSPCVVSGTTYSAFSDQVRAAMTDMVAPALEKATAPEQTPVDVARAQYILFIKSFRLPDAEVDVANLDSLLGQKREQEPVEINYFARIPGEVSYYAHTLVNKRDYSGAVAVFQKLVEAYPNSDLARRSQESIDALLPLCK